MVRIGRGVSFRVENLRMGTSLCLEKQERQLRICSVATGKVRVRLDGEKFAIGLNGVIKIKPGSTYTIENRLYVDACLYITAFNV